MAINTPPPCEFLSFLKTWRWGGKISADLTDGSSQDSVPIMISGFTVSMSEVIPAIFPLILRQFIIAIWIPMWPVTFRWALCFWESGLGLGVFPSMRLGVIFLLVFLSFPTIVQVLSILVSFNGGRGRVSVHFDWSLTSLMRQLTRSGTDRASWSWVRVVPLVFVQGSKTFKGI